MKVVLIADPPHGNRVIKELSSLGHEVECVRDAGGDARRAIHPGTEWVVLMSLHSERHLIPEKAREVGARLVWSGVGWSHCREALAKAGFPFTAAQPDMFDAGPEPVAALAVVEPAPLRASFVFEGSAVEVLVENGEPIFLAADVCERCGISNVPDAMTRLDDDEKAKKVQPSVQPRGGVAPAPTRWYVTEAGLYSLVNGSRTPESKRFRRWVNHDVLPSIRRTGSYSIAQPETREQLVARALQASNQIITERDATIHVLKAEKEELITEAAAGRAISDGNGSRTPTEAGKIWGITNATEALIELGYAYRRGGRAMPRAQHGHAGSGLIIYKTLPPESCNGTARDQMYVTDKGMVVIARRMVLEGLIGADVLAEIRKRFAEAA